LWARGFFIPSIISLTLITYILVKNFRSARSIIIFFTFVIISINLYFAYNIMKSDYFLRAHTLQVEERELVNFLNDHQDIKNKAVIFDPNLIEIFQANNFVKNLYGHAFNSARTRKDEFDRMIYVSELFHINRSDLINLLADSLDNELLLRNSVFKAKPGPFIEYNQYVSAALGRMLFRTPIFKSLFGYEINSDKFKDIVMKYNPKSDYLENNSYFLVHNIKSNIEQNFKCNGDIVWKNSKYLICSKLQ